jgi:CRISPR-associated protein Csb1
MTDMSSRLSAAVAEKSMIRLVVKLRPANADGLVYPPTYDQGTHIFRPAWINGEKRAGVVLDSVQSQANRIEVAILDASRRNRITYPDIELRIKASTGEEVYSVLELSHRVYDAALRMANLNGTLFVNSEIGKQVYAARTERASALFTHAPVTLALGGWDTGTVNGFFIGGGRFTTSTLNGTFAEQSDIGGTFSSSYGTTGTLSVSFDPLFNRPSPLALLEGTWSYTEPGYSISIDVDDQGEINGSDSDGCVFFGVASVLDPEHNTYGIDIDVTNCGPMNDTYSGLAILNDELTLNDTLRYFVYSQHYILFNFLTRQ